MLSADEATEAALRHGLAIEDAVSLRALADDPAEADRIAARFADDQAPDRQMVRALFGTNERVQLPDVPEQYLGDRTDPNRRPAA